MSPPWVIPSVKLLTPFWRWMVAVPMAACTWSPATSDGAMLNAVTQEAFGP